MTALLLQSESRTRVPDLPGALQRRPKAGRRRGKLACGRPESGGAILQPSLILPLPPMPHPRRAPTSPCVPSFPQVRVALRWARAHPDRIPVSRLLGIRFFLKSFVLSSISTSFWRPVRGPWRSGGMSLPVTSPELVFLMLPGAPGLQANIYRPVPRAAGYVRQCSIRSREVSDPILLQSWPSSASSQVLGSGPSQVLRSGLGLGTRQVRSLGWLQGQAVTMPAAAPALGASSWHAT